ncbi:MAG: hypothetical protein ABI678_12070 [Kofleriaceae bacterium]
MKWAWLVVMAASGVAAGEPVRTPYDAGVVTIHAGLYQQNRDLRGARLGAGYNVAHGLELGLALSYISGDPADLSIFEPFATYNFTGWYQQLPLVPYLGLAWKHRWTAPNYYIADTLGARAGLALTFAPGRYPVVIGGGIAWDHPVVECAFDDCRQYRQNPEELGPEVFVTMGF